MHDLFHFDDLIRAQLAQRESVHQLRRRTVVRSIDATHVEIDGATYVNFASNDYLGLSHHPQVIAAMRNSITEVGAGSAAAGLITGYTPLHASAEQSIAQWKGTEASVLLPSGYQANHAAIQTIEGIARAAGRGVRFLIDKLAHASLIDAVRGADDRFRVFPHNHLEKLERLLAEGSADELQVVVTESIFSMDGDAADLAGIVRLKQKYPFLLVLDEAHGSGVYGANGAGYANEVELGSQVDVTVVTLSKAMGVMGGAICGSRAFCEAVVNFGRGYIYSTSVTGCLAAGAAAAIKIMHEDVQRQLRVREVARRVRGELNQQRWEIPAGDSPIVPITVGEEARAIELSEKLRAERLWVVAVRPPTVARGASRLRVTLSSEHSDDEIDRLVHALKLHK